MTRRRAHFVSRNIRAFTILFSLILILAGCGGGPNVSTSTGRILYISTTNGIYGYSIMSDGTLKALSSQALKTGSFLQIAATSGTPPNQSSPLLVGADGSNAVSAWSIGGTGSLSSTTVTLPTYTGCTPLTNITGVSATLDNNYLVLLDGSLSSSNIESFSLSNGSCSTYSTLTTYFPIQAALDCSDPSLPSTSCDILLTLSTTDIQTTGFNATNPEEDVYSESGTSLAQTTPSATTFSGCTNCPLGTAFNNTTLYFYNSFNTSPSLQSFAPKSATATAQVALTNSNLKLPCVDPIGGVAYIPTTNAYLYSVTTGSGGILGTVTTLLTPSTFGTTLQITSCAVVTNP